MRPDLLLDNTEQARAAPTTAVSQELQAPILLSDQEMKLVAGAGWFDDVLHTINTPPAIPTILSML
jgi:hypothetical protein